MRVSVLHFHPVAESLSAAVLEAVTTTLAADGHAVEVHRLHDGDDPDVGIVGASDALVLVYPTWWGGQPAALLDWIQRHLASWIDAGSRSASPLRGVRYLVAVTTHGSSHFVNRIQGEPGRQLFERVLPRLCAPDVDVRWISLYTCDRTTEADRAAFLQRVRSEVRLTSPAAEATSNR